MIYNPVELLRAMMLRVATHIPASLANRLIRGRYPTVAQHSAGCLLFACSGQRASFIDVRGMSIATVHERVTTLRRQLPEARVVLVCDIGYCSARAVARLMRSGHRNVVNLEGGLRALRQLHHDIDNYAAQRTG